MIWMVHLPSICSASLSWHCRPIVTTPTSSRPILARARYRVAFPTISPSPPTIRFCRSKLSSPRSTPTSETQMRVKCSLSRYPVSKSLVFCCFALLQLSTQQTASREQQQWKWKFHPKIIRTLVFLITELRCAHGCRSEVKEKKLKWKDIYAFQSSTRLGNLFSV